MAVDSYARSVAAAALAQSGEPKGTTDYEDLTSKPRINNVELMGDMVPEDLGLAGSVVITATASRIINGYNVPDLTAEDVTKAYNAIVGGKVCVIIDNANKCYYTVDASDEVDAHIHISYMYFGIMYLTYSVQDEEVIVNYVNIADKEYVDAKVKEVEMFKFPNTTIVGEPTITHGQVSGFTMNDYLEFPFLVDFRNRAFEINFAFTTGLNVNTQQNILDSDFGLAFAIRNGHFVLALSFDGKSWATEQTGSLLLQQQTTYRVKITWNRLLYKVQYSIDGGNTYIDDITFGQTQSPYPKQMYIGVGKLADNYFEGIINLNYANVLISDQVIWQGMDDVGLSTRMATDMSNIDAAGVERVREITKEVQVSNAEPTNDNIIMWVDENEEGEVFNPEDYVKSEVVKKIVVVTEYPEIMEENVLYLLKEE